MYFKIILKTFSYKKHEIHTGDITSREDHGKTTSKPAQGPVTIQLPLPVFLRAVSDSASARHRLSNYSRLTKPAALYKTFLEPLGSEGIGRHLRPFLQYEGFSAACHEVLSSHRSSVCNCFQNSKRNTGISLRNEPRIYFCLL